MDWKIWRPLLKIFKKTFFTNLIKPFCHQNDMWRPNGFVFFHPSLSQKFPVTQRKIMV